MLVEIKESVVVVGDRDDILTDVGVADALVELSLVETVGTSVESDLVEVNVTLAELD